MSELITIGSVMLLVTGYVSLWGYVNRCRSCGKWWSLKRTKRVRFYWPRSWWTFGKSESEYRCGRCKKREWWVDVDGC